MTSYYNFFRIVFRLHIDYHVVFESDNQVFLIKSESFRFQFYIKLGLNFRVEDLDLLYKILVLIPEAHDTFVGNSQESIFVFTFVNKADTGDA